MKPIDAIEYVLRSRHGSVTKDSLIAEVTELVDRKYFDEPRMKMALRDGKTRFVTDRDGTITLHPERMADRIGYFREHLMELRHAFRSVSLGQTLGLEMALIFLLAKLPGDEWLRISSQREGLQAALAGLVNEFPALEFEVTPTLRLDEEFIRSRVLSNLRQMALAHLSPTEYVQTMRELLTQDAHMGRFCTPWSVALLMARLLGKVEEVFDPAADASVLPLVLAVSPPRSVKIGAVFFNRFAMLFTTLQARILGADLNATFSESLVPVGINKKYTHCISAPPFVSRVKEASGHESALGYEAAINQIIKRLGPNGRAVVVVPESALFTEALTQFRRRLITEGSLQKVISLPIGAFAPYAQIKTNILVLDKSLTPDYAVTFIDASNYFLANIKGEKVADVDRLLYDLQAGSLELPSIRVAKAKILQGSFVPLFVSLHLLLLNKPATTEINTTEKHVELGDLVSLAKGAKDATGTEPYFQVAELASEAMDLVHTARHGRAERPTSAKNAKMLNEDALLLARIGGVLKPTLFDPAEGAIALGSNVIAFRVDTTRVDPRYLALELRSGFVQEQVSNYVKGSGVPSIAKADLLRLMVRLPDRDQQLRVVDQQFDLGLFMEQLKDAAAPIDNEQLDQLSKLVIKNTAVLGTSGLKKVLWDWMLQEQMLTEQRVLGAVKENMKMLRHQFNNRLGWVTTGMGNVVNCIDRLVDEGTIPIDLPIAPSLDGEETPSPTIVHTLQQLLRNGEELPKLFNGLVESLDRDGLHMEFIELDEYYRNAIAPLYENDYRFKLHYYPSSSGSTTAYADRNALKQVVVNIMDNAVKHGFLDMSRKYNLFVHIDDGNFFIANDGEPPSISLKEMTIRSRSAGVNAGTGEGMYWALTLMQQMGGSLHQLFNSDKLWDTPVSFAVSLGLPAES
ncbi:MAG: N-6 DNA methylase [Flavobacteriales bacterium]